MKTTTSKWRYTGYLIGLLITVTLCPSGCHYKRQSIERIMQNEMQCEMAVQMAWGDGINDLGYVSDGEPSIHAYLPLRFQVDSVGHIYVTDPLNERVMELSAKGELITSFVVPLSKDLEFIKDVAIGGNQVVVATTDHIYTFDQEGDFLQILKWPAGVGNYGLCSEDMAGRKVQVDERGNIYACGLGGFERGGTIIQFDARGNSRVFYVGAFNHFIVGQDGFIYITQLSDTERANIPPDERVLQFDPRGAQLGEIIISGEDLANAGLVSPGLLVAVDAKGYLYGDVVNAIEDGEIVSFNALVQINKDGKILRIIERDKFIRPATDVVDGAGNLYIWNFGRAPSEPAEIWRCHF